MNGRTKSLIVCLAINAIALCVFAQAESASQEFQRGKALFDKGQTKEAFKLLKSSAGKGYGPAMNAIGFCYQYGKGVSKNYTNAAQWYRNAAVQGNATGAYNYGWMYLKGVGVDKNNDVAKKWLKIAANAGNADAKTVLRQEGWLNEKPEPPKKAELPSKKSESPSKISESPSKKPDTKTQNNTRRETKTSNRSRTYSQSDSKWRVGKWDSKIYNRIDHPKTVALRIEVVDKETQRPIPNVSISFEGEYWIGPRTTFDPEGERKAQEIEYKVTCQTGLDGIAVGAFGWHKEYPWSHENDDVDKAQRIEFRHLRYKYVELRTPFYRFLEVGQKKTAPYSTDEDTRQQTDTFERFEKTWALECAKRDVKFFVLDLGTNYKGFDNKESVNPEFFERIRDRKWSVVFDKPRNMMQWGMGNGRSWCGPYLVYLIEIQMERRSGQVEILSEETNQPENSVVNTMKKELNDTLIAAIRTIPMKDPDTGQITTFDQFARKAVKNLGLEDTIFSEDPVAGTYMILFDKNFLLTKAPLIKMPDGSYMSLIDAIEKSVQQTDSESLKKLVEGITEAHHAYEQGQLRLALRALSGILSEVSRRNGALVIQPGPKQESLVAHWRFDEGSGIAASDSSGNNNDGTIAVATWTGGIFGQALTFDGVSSYVYGTPFTTASQGSIFAWIKPVPAPPAHTIFQVVGTENIRDFLSFRFMEYGGSQVLEFYTKSYGSVSSQRQLMYTNSSADLNLMDGTWHLVGLTHDGASYKFYVDGVELTKLIYSHASGDHWWFDNLDFANIDEWNIGRNNLEGEANSYFAGSIDDVRIYNRALSQEECEFLANSRPGGN